MTYLLSHYTLVGFIILWIVTYYCISWIFVEDVELKDDGNCILYYKDFTPDMLITFYSFSRQFIKLLKCLNQGDRFMFVCCKIEMFVCIFCSIVVNDSSFLTFPIIIILSIIIILLYSNTIEPKDNNDIIEFNKFIRSVKILMLILALWGFLIIINDRYNLIETILKHF